MSWKPELRGQEVPPGHELEVRVSLTIRTIDDDAGEVVDRLFREQILSDIAEWFAFADEQDEAWQALEHTKSWAIKAGEIEVTSWDESLRHRARRRY